MKQEHEAKTPKPFEQWRAQEVERKFGLEKIDRTPALTQWLSVAGDTPVQWQAFMEELRLALFLDGGAWNETELLNRFISPFLRTLGFTDRKRKVTEYSARPLVLWDDNFPAKGVVDWFVAYGDADQPDTPYLFLHEYKRLQSASPDPLGQLLIAMLTAQRLNNDNLPLYGTWIMGRNWQFVLLHNKIYSESYVYDATNPEELSQIWLILNKTKYIIYDRVDSLLNPQNIKAE